MKKERGYKVRTVLFCCRADNVPHPPSEYESCNALKCKPANKHGFVNLLCLYGAISGIIFLATAVMGNAGSRTEILEIGCFSRLDAGSGLPIGWQPLTFKKIKRHTIYSLVSDQGTTVIKARSENAASGLIRPMDLDPQQFPIIQWKWKIIEALAGSNITRKSGDDFAARIYVTFAFDSKQAGFWKKLAHKAASSSAGRKLPGSALIYVWSSHDPVGSIAPNPYSSDVRMVVVRSGNAMAGKWVSQSRNILEDYQRAFGRKAGIIEGIAIMTDTDNTAASTTAYYGDIVLRQKEPALP